MKSPLEFLADLCFGIAVISFVVFVFACAMDLFL